MLCWSSLWEMKELPDLKKGNNGGNGRPAGSEGGFVLKSGDGPILVIRRVRNWYAMIREMTRLAGGRRASKSRISTGGPGGSGAGAGAYAMDDGGASCDGQKERNGLLFSGSVLILPVQRRRCWNV